MIRTYNSLLIVTLVGALAFLSTLFSPRVYAQPQSAQICKTTCVVLLGVGAGRTSYRGSPQGGPSTAIAVGSDVYVVDFGRGWEDNYFRAGLGAPPLPVPGGAGIQSLRAAFVTHMHSDHLVGYPQLLLMASDGLSRRQDPIQIYGPGSGGTITWSKLIPEDKRAPLVNPEHPRPGITEATNLIYQAFAADINSNIAGSGKKNPHSYIKTHDIEVPVSVGASPDNPAPKMSPIKIYEDENVKVTAILVDHGAIAPAFAYRFDTEDGSIVVSGDTTFAPNLVRLARGADIFISEVISPRWVDSLFPEPQSTADKAKIEHLMQTHMTPKQVVSVARDAKVKMVILSHLAPATYPDYEWLRHMDGFSGIKIVGKPFTKVNLPLDASLPEPTPVW